ncbi:MAG: hypothetical protein RIQ78_629 [Bacteroidota bacterium]|jgi:hypothetical protein
MAMIRREEPGKEMLGIIHLGSVSYLLSPKCNSREFQSHFWGYAVQLFESND